VYLAAQYNIKAPVEVALAEDVLVLHQALELDLVEALHQCIARHLGLPDVAQLLKRGEHAGTLGRSPYLTTVRLRRHQQLLNRPEAEPERGERF
jgi:hypothetical protein